MQRRGQQKRREDDLLGKWPGSQHNEPKMNDITWK